MHVSLEKAASLLNEGDVVAVATETVYGLAASVHHQEAIDAIFSIKGRPANNPLIVHVSTPEQLLPYVNGLPPSFNALTEALWPGPLTIVLPVKENSLFPSICAGLPTAAFRVPAHPLARQLLNLTGPLVMPSANLSGRPSATSAAHVEVDFGPDFPVLDGGPCSCGLESTIIIYNDHTWKIIRLGALPVEAFQPILGYLPSVESAKNQKIPLCPGQLYRHYAPAAKLTLTSSFNPEMRGVVLGYSGRHYPEGLRLISLGSENRPEQVAESLYDALRLLDAESVEEAWVDIDVPSDGLWRTILERLNKAAAS